MSLSDLKNISTIGKRLDDLEKSNQDLKYRVKYLEQEVQRLESVKMNSSERSVIIAEAGNYAYAIS
jgi:cell division septum initiation protein DivIVA